MELEVPKGIFQAYIIHYLGPTSCVVGEAKEDLLLQMSGDHGKKFVLLSIVYDKRFHIYKKRKKKKVYIFKKSAHPLFGAWSLHLVHIQFTTSQRPKGFQSTVLHL